MGNKIVDNSETTKDGTETVRCSHTLEVLGKSFVVDGVRYYVPIEKLKT
jgi:hypothetical protein